MAQQFGYTEAGAERTHAAVDQLLIGPGSVAVAQTVVSHGTGGTFILDLRSHLIDVLLEPGNGDVGGHTVRDEQLVPPGRVSQQLFQFDGNAFIDGDSAN